MENRLVLIGGGGHCKSVLDSAVRMDFFKEIVITDPNIPVGTKIWGYPVVGADDCLQTLKSSGFGYAFVTVGDVKNDTIRRKLAAEAKDSGFEFPVIIDPSAVVSEHVTIGEGSFIGKGVIVNADTRIGEHCIINTGAILEHECCVGDFSHVSVGSILCGGVSVGMNSFIGAGSTVIQCVNIGDNVTIGANSTVLGNVENDTKYYGVVSKKNT